MRVRVRRRLALVLAGLGVFGPSCGGGASDSGDTLDARPGTPPDAAPVEAPDARPGPDASAAPCERLFGQPNERTGLTAEQCAPSCACGGLDFTAPSYDADFIAAARRFVLAAPFADLTEDPYADAPPAATPGVPVCGVLPVAGAPGEYTLETFASPEALDARGATLTHHGACGLCSPLADLAVYMAYPDLTQPVRACGVRGLSEGLEANLSCLLDLGFTAPCARIWLYNTQNTRRACLAECLRDLDAPYHLPDGSLNPCLRCDEERSGPVFKAIAGRTRRNSGLPNAMCRPCSEANPVVHDYGGL